MQRDRRQPCLRSSVISAPCTSAPSTRQEQTNRPFTVTEQAPQSPVPQPSFAPVSRKPVAQHIQQRLIGIADELDRIAVDQWWKREATSFGTSGTGIGNMCGTAGENAGGAGTKRDSAALVVNRVAGGLAGSGKRRQGSVLKLGADDRLGGGIDQHDLGRDCPQSHARGAYRCHPHPASD